MNLSARHLQGYKMIDVLKIFLIFSFLQNYIDGMKSNNPNICSGRSMCLFVFETGLGMECHYARSFDPECTAFRRNKKGMALHFYNCLPKNDTLRGYLKKLMNQMKHTEEREMRNTICTTAIRNNIEEWSWDCLSNASYDEKMCLYTDRKGKCFYEKPKSKELCLFEDKTLSGPISYPTLAHCRAFDADYKYHFNNISEILHDSGDRSLYQSVCKKTALSQIEDIKQSCTWEREPHNTMCLVTPSPNTCYLREDKGAWCYLENKFLLGKTGRPTISRCSEKDENFIKNFNKVINSLQKENQIELMSNLCDAAYRNEISDLSPTYDWTWTMYYSKTMCLYTEKSGFCSYVLVKETESWQSLQGKTLYDNDSTPPVSNCRPFNPYIQANQKLNIDKLVELRMQSAAIELCRFRAKNRTADPPIAEVKEIMHRACSADKENYLCLYMTTEDDSDITIFEVENHSTTEDCEFFLKFILERDNFLTCIDLNDKYVKMYHEIYLNTTNILFQKDTRSATEDVMLGMATSIRYLPYNFAMWYISHVKDKLTERCDDWTWEGETMCLVEYTREGRKRYTHYMVTGPVLLDICRTNFTTEFGAITVVRCEPFDPELINYLAKSCSDKPCDIEIFKKENFDNLREKCRNMSKLIENITNPMCLSIQKTESNCAFIRVNNAEKFCLDEHANAPENHTFQFSCLPYDEVHASEFNATVLHSKNNNFATKFLPIICKEVYKNPENVQSCDWSWRKPNQAVMCLMTLENGVCQFIEIKTHFREWCGFEKLFTDKSNNLSHVEPKGWYSTLKACQPYSYSRFYSKNKVIEFYSHPLDRINRDIFCKSFSEDI